MEIVPNDAQCLCCVSYGLVSYLNVKNVTEKLSFISLPFIMRSLLDIYLGTSRQCTNEKLPIILSLWISFFKAPKVECFLCSRRNNENIICEIKPYQILRVSKNFKDI